jgi:Zn-dependent peptidase ImmA (M78 family)
VPRALIKRPTFEAVQKFEEYCGFSVSDVNIISMPEELFNQEIRDRVLAMCYNDPILNEKTIILIIENFYVLKDIDQRLTIYHELGHCVLDLEHTEKRNHIMHKSDAPNLTDEQALKQLCKKRKKK